MIDSKTAYHIRMERECGQYVGAIASKHGIPIGAVKRILAGITFPGVKGPLFDVGPIKTKAGESLTADKIKEVRLEANAGKTLSELSKEYGESVAVLSSVVQGNIWPDAGGPVSDPADNCRKMRRSLTDEQAHNMRIRWRDGYPMRYLSSLYDGVSSHAIYSVVTGESYKDVSGPITQSKDRLQVKWWEIVEIREEWESHREIRGVSSPIAYDFYMFANSQESRKGLTKNSAIRIVSGHTWGDVSGPTEPNLCTKFLCPSEMIKEEGDG